ncbi:hypothetical protein ACFL2C_03060 [Patescibacteria group bacterium]
MRIRHPQIDTKKLINILPIFLVFLVAIMLRFGLSPQGFHVDIFSNAGWGEWIYQNGTLGFYENNVWVYSWPTQPPLVSILYGLSAGLYETVLELLRQSTNFIVRFHLAPGHMVWWFNFVIWFDNPLTLEIPFPVGYLMSIKSIAILADIAITSFVYWIARKEGRRALLWSAVYLFSPFTWYLSALWGQYDGVAYMFALTAFLSLVKLPVFSPLLFAVSVSLKPTTILFLPLFAWVYFKRRPKTKSVVVGIAVSAVFTYLSIKVFAPSDVVIFIREVLVPKILFKSEFRVSTNAYNFWHIFTLDKAIVDNTKFLLLPARVWGIFAYTVLNIIGFKIIKKVSFKNVLCAMFVVGAGSWLFLTGMLDRYYFAGVTTGLFVVLYYPKLFKYWLIASLVFWMNLYRQWWYPEMFEPLKQVLIARSGLVGVFLSLVNVGVYISMARYVLLDYFGKSK